MLKHILTGQPSSTAGSRLQHHDFLAAGAAGPSGLQHHQHQSHGLREQLRAGGRAQSSADVYDNVAAGQAACPVALGQRAAPQLQPGQRHHPLNHSLNHSQLSVNNLAQRLNASQHSHHALNLSTLSTSKHSVNSVSPVVGPGLGLGYAERASQRNNLSMLSQTQALLAQLREQQLLERERSKPNGGLDISRASRLPSQATPSPAQPATATPACAPQSTTTAPSASTGPSIVPLNVSWSSSELSRQHKSSSLEAGVKEMLTSLGLLCLVSLLLALLSLTFLVKMTSVSPVPNGNSLISLEEFAIVHDVTLVLCALALSLNLCCLLVCAIQFLFAVKLVKSSYHGHRTNKYLQKSSISRVCAVGGFFISIPVFLTGMILYTFIQFQSTPAIVTSVFIGLGIVFCGCALVHTVFVWQKEKTNAMKALRREQYEAAAQLQRQQTLHSQQQQHQPQHQQSQSQQSHQHQQQQQQHQQQQQQQPRSLPANCGVASRLAGHEQLAAGSVGPLSLGGAHPRSLAAQQQLHQLHQLHNHRHVSMSPPLLLSSASNGLHHGPSQRGALSHSLLGPASPPATPGDRSPTSPANKHNRSQMSREAATGSVSPGLPAATLDLSSAANTNSPHELSTLV